MNTTVAMIPARIGSTRLKMKNLALLNGKPLIYYAISAAKKSGVFDRIIINSDNKLFADIADRYNVEFYHRPKNLGGSDVKSDQVVIDFLENHPCKYIAWVNPIAPLQTGSEIKAVVEYCKKNSFDTLHTVRNEQVHCNYKNSPINYSYSEIFAKTQDLIPVQSFVYTVMMWKASTFIEHFNKNGYAIFCGQTGFFEINKVSGIIIKDKGDLILAESILAQLEHSAFDETLVQYDSLAGEVDK